MNTSTPSIYTHIHPAPLSTYTKILSIFTSNKIQKYYNKNSLLQFPVHYSRIVFGIIFMPFCCPWCPRVLGWVSTQPGFVYPSDILQGLSRWACLSLSLVNHFLWLILRVQLLYSFIGYCIVQFQCAVIIHRCLFFLCRPILDGFLNFALSVFRTFLFCSD